MTPTLSHLLKYEKRLVVLEIIICLFCILFVIFCSLPEAKTNISPCENGVERNQDLVNTINPNKTQYCYSCIEIEPNKVREDTTEDAPPETFAETQDQETLFEHHEDPVPYENEYISPGSPGEWMDFVITAYCSCPQCCLEWYYTQPIDENGNRIIHTANGELAIEEWTVASDWNVLPPGTIVEIEGVGIRRVSDCGVFGNHIDLYYSSHEKACEFGLMNTRVRIVEEAG